MVIWCKLWCNNDWRKILILYKIWCKMVQILIPAMANKVSLVKKKVSRAVREMDQERNRRPKKLFSHVRYTCTERARDWRKARQLMKEKMLPRIHFPLSVIAYSCRYLYHYRIYIPITISRLLSLPSTWRLLYFVFPSLILTSSRGILSSLAWR